jgi:hypothetical protein
MPSFTIDQRPTGEVYVSDGGGTRRKFPDLITAMGFISQKAGDGNFDATRSQNMLGRTSRFTSSWNKHLQSSEGINPEPEPEPEPAEQQVATAPTPVVSINKKKKLPRKGKYRWVPGMGKVRQLTIKR